LGSIASVCVIYFHPNAADIGDCVLEMEIIRDGAFDGDAVVLAPEYPGYGLLIEFTPTVAGIDRVATAAWQYCLEGLGFPACRVVLWGRSIGTGPATALAQSLAHQPPEAETLASLSPEPGAGSISKQPPVGALVLVAPFTSIVDVAKHHTNTWASALLSPMWEIGNLVKDPGFEDVPLLILHPAEDEVIPPEHGSTILENSASKNRLGIWLRGATHNFVLQEEHLARAGEFLGKFFGISRPGDDGSDDDVSWSHGGGGGATAGERRPAVAVDGGDPDEQDLQDIISRLVWWSASGRADSLV